MSDRAGVLLWADCYFCCPREYAQRVFDFDYLKRELRCEMCGRTLSDSLAEKNRTRLLAYKKKLERLRKKEEEGKKCGSAKQRRKWKRKRLILEEQERRDREN